MLDGRLAGIARTDAFAVARDDPNLVFAEPGASQIADGYLRLVPRFKNANCNVSLPIHV
jgi:hypothetical protein